jgi:nitrogen fixation protein NifZ
VRPRFEYGEAVRVVRNVRNDGTFPGEPTGRLLIRRGSVGYVRDVGTFLQDQLVYSVDFFEQQRMVGCREQELQPASDPWVPNRFEFHEKVTPTVSLGIRGEVIARPGDAGEIEQVLREQGETPRYHVRFHGRTLLVPEDALAFLGGANGESDGID